MSERRRCYSDGALTPASTVLLLLALVALMALVAALFLPLRNTLHADPAPPKEHLAVVLPPLVTWVLSSAVLVVSLVIAMGVAIRAVWWALADAKGMRSGFLAVIVSTLVALIAFAVFVGPLFAPLYAILGLDGELGQDPDYAHALGGLGMAATVVVGAGACALAYGPRGDATVLRRRWRAFRTLLYLAAIGLASGAIATDARLQVQIAPTSSAETMEAAHRIASAASLAYGGLFTLFLFAIFLPVAGVLRSAADDLAVAANPNGTPAAREQWMQDQQLRSGATSKAVQVLAAFAPLASSIGAGLAKAIAGM